MKRAKYYISLFAALLLGGVLFFHPTEVSAKKKPNYTIKGSTLTITGTIPRNTTFRNAGKLKKVVIKDKVKKLPAEPFKKCKKVKHLQVPGNVKFDYKEKEYGICKWIFPVTVDEVTFSTSLKNIREIEQYKTKKFVISKKDKKYASEKGIIYNKKKTEFIGMPSESKNLTILDGCETVNIYGFSYKAANRQYYEDWSDDEDSACKKIKKITFPASVKKLKVAAGSGYFGMIRNVDFDLKNLIYNRESIDIFFSMLGIEKFKQCFEPVVTTEGDFLIYNQTHLLGYTGCEKEVKIPEGVKTARIRALLAKDFDSYRMIENVIFPDSYIDNRTEIWKEGSFKDSDYHYNIEEIQAESSDKEAYYLYCRHEKGKLIKIVAKVDGYLSVKANRYKMTFYDEGMNALSTIEDKQRAAENKLPILIKQVKAGEVVYAKVPDDGKNDDNMIGEINCPRVISMQKGSLFLGTGEKEYRTLKVDARKEFTLKLLGYENKHSATIQIEKKNGDAYVPITKELTSDKDGYANYVFILEKGEYRIAYRGEKGKFFYSQTYLDNQKVGGIAKTKAIAKDITSSRTYRGGMSYEDGKTSWFTFTKQSKKIADVEVYGIFTDNSKVTVTLYKKGNTKAVATKTFMLGAKNNFRKKVGKGTYYIKIVRKSTLSPCTFEVSVLP